MATDKTTRLEALDEALIDAFDAKLRGEPTAADLAVIAKYLKDNQTGTSTSHPKAAKLMDRLAQMANDLPDQGEYA